MRLMQHCVFSEWVMIWWAVQHATTDNCITYFIVCRPLATNDWWLHTWTELGGYPPIRFAVYLLRSTEHNMSARLYTDLCGTKLNAMCVWFEMNITISFSPANVCWQLVKWSRKLSCNMLHCSRNISWKFMFVGLLWVIDFLSSLASSIFTIDDFKNAKPNVRYQKNKRLHWTELNI